MYAILLEGYPLMRPHVVPADLPDQSTFRPFTSPTRGDRHCYAYLPTHIQLPGIIQAKTLETTAQSIMCRYGGIILYEGPQRMLTVIQGPRCYRQRTTAHLPLAPFERRRTEFQFHMCLPPTGIDQRRTDKWRPSAARTDRRHANRWLDLHICVEPKRGG